MCRVDDGCFVEQDISLFSLYHAAVVAHVFCSFHGEKPMILNSRLNAVAFLFD